MNDIGLFENWFKSTKWFTGDNCTPKYKTYRSMLQAWQASAQREDCRLVAVESTKEHIHKFEEITVNGDDARKYICIYCGFEKSESFND